MRKFTIIISALLIWSCNSPELKKSNEVSLKAATCLLKYIGKNDSLLSIDTIKMDTIDIVSYLVLHKYPNGKKKSVTEYGDCKKSGRDTLFYDNGQIKYVRDIIGNTIFFTHRFYSINGDSLNPGNVIWGEGTIYNYYDDGKLESTGHVKNGLPDGEWIRHYQNGKISSKTFYHNKNTEAGIEFTIDGKMTFYRPSGIIQRESTVDKGVIKYVKEFDENGFLIKEYPANDVMNFTEE